MHRNRIELIARSLQIHSQGTDGSNLLRPDTRRRFVELGNEIFFRSQRDILSGLDSSTYLHCLLGCELSILTRVQNCALILNKTATRAHVYVALDINLVILIDRARFRDQLCILSGRQSSAQGQANSRIHGYAAIGSNIAILINIIARCQRYILPCREVRLLVEIAARCQSNIALCGEISGGVQATAHLEILDRDIPCYLPVDSNSQRRSIIFDTHVAGNGRFLPLIGRDAVRSDFFELIVLVFQQQGFAAHSINLIGGDSAFVRLGDASIDGLQCQYLLRICQISRLHRAVQRQIVISGKRRITTGVDRAFHRHFHNISDTVLFFFPAHRQRAVAFCNEFSLGIDISKYQRAIPDTQSQASHAPDIGGFRCDIHRPPVIQNADRIVRLAHNTGIGVGFKFQFLSGVDVRLGNICVGLAH